MKREFEPRYHSYLLRLWPVEIDGQMIWRVAMESVQTHEQLYFASLDACCLFLKKQAENYPLENLR